MPETAILPDWCAWLPHLNAVLNSLATLLLILGFISIRQGHALAHRRLMLSAFGTSVAFLGSYLAYHIGLRIYTGSHGKSFAGLGWSRPIYFAMLISHVVLAAIVPVLAIVTISRGLRGDWIRHRRIAKVTFPIWLYVSVTGVLIYLMLYQWPSGF